MRNTALFVSIILSLALLLGACADQVTDSDLSVHPPGYMQAGQHGRAVLESPNKALSCESCHGDDLHGGTSAVSCYECHAPYPHPEGFSKSESSAFHANYIQDNHAWDITGCTNCHGQDYAGGDLGEKNCLTCHTDGPTSCTTCHGEGSSAAPPADLMGLESTSEVTVGIHQKHLSEGFVANFGQDACVHCHPSVESFSDPTHLDDPSRPSPADVVFSDLATQNGRTTPVWDREAGTCSNVYCHGSFTFNKSESEDAWGYAEDTIRGNDLTLGWTEPLAEKIKCGSCHGLPPEGHRKTDERVTVGECSTCHPRVIDSSFNLNKQLHINGKVELF